MKVRSQRTHFMGFSNRNRGIQTGVRNVTTDLFEKSFNKSKSQYYQTATQQLDKISVTLKSGTNKLNQTSSAFSIQPNFNHLYSQSQKGHHYQLSHTRLSANKKSKDIASLYRQQPSFSPSPVNLNHRLNQQIGDIKEEFQNQDINLHKLKELKSTFLRNNEKRRNLKDYFGKYAQQNSGKMNKDGFKKLIKDYGYDITESQINLVWRLNQVHQHSEKQENTPESIKQIKAINQIDLPQFINLMTKQNIYFKTLKLNSQSNPQQQPSSFRFQAAEFQIFRNKFPKLREALNVYKGQSINFDKFQKIMKKLDINDLVIKQSKRQQVFKQFSKDGELNVEQLLSMIARQEHQRVHKSGNQLKVSNHDNFEQNLQVNQQFAFKRQNQKDPLLDILYPISLKHSSFPEFQRHLSSAKTICSKLQQINTKNSNLLASVLDTKQTIKKQDLFRKVQKVLQKQGYNFTKHQYKSFLAYLDFDSAGCISKNNFEKFVLKETESERVDRLDRRKRNPKSGNLERADVLNEENAAVTFGKNNNNNNVSAGKNIDDQDFAQRFRSKSSMNWNSLKRTFIAQENIPQFKVPTKFSAWPERLYNADFSMIQAKSSYGIGQSQQKRFNKQEKHSYGQQDKQRRQRLYQNKVRKTAQWQQFNELKLVNKSNFEQGKQMQKQYNLRLIKQQYQQRCHNNAPNQ